MTPSVRVLCVDDNALVVDAMQVRLRHEGLYDLIGVLDRADDVVTFAASARPDIILMDVDMPGKDPFLVVRELSEQVPSARVVMLSGHVRRDLVDRAFDAGAWGYVSKSGGTDAILDAIRKVVGGEFAMGPDVEAAWGKH